jgi:uncharacterized protein YdeI (YjbR/CyaY-like superfamily)
MKITTTHYPKNREEWRKWLEKNHKTAKEIWVIYYKKNSGKPRIPYDEAVEEALCFGWIDGQAQGIDEHHYAQRFSPRRPKSNWSELNKERVRKLIKNGQMTTAGLDAFPHEHKASKLKIPKDILKAIKANKDAWEYFQHMPESYKRVRIAWIHSSGLPEQKPKRLAYFIKMTAQNKKFGSWK